MNRYEILQRTAIAPRNQESHQSECGQSIVTQHRDYTLQPIQDSSINTGQGGAILILQRSDDL